MIKKVLIGAVVAIVVVSGGLFIWARSVFGQETVRDALAAQISSSIGQPVTIGSLGATIFPRVTVSLGEVTIGDPAKITVAALNVGTDFGALLSRRIEHASLNLSGARVELPLPDFAIAPTEQSAAGESEGSAVELVSIDEIVLSDVEIVSGGRTLKGDIEGVPAGKGVELRKMTLAAEDTTVNITGTIADLEGPVGDLTVQAGALNFDDLMAFVTDFSQGVGPAGGATSSGATPKPAGQAPPMNLTISLAADRATFGQLAIDKLSGRARATAEALALEPISFGVFNGRYEGALALSLGETPDFRLKANLSGVDMAAATAFAQSPNTVTGRLSGTIDLAGTGLDAPSVLRTARGSARVDIADGTVKNLGLVRTIVVATSGRENATTENSGGSRDEPFSRLGGTLSIASGAASTENLSFESRDLLLAAAGRIGLDGSSIDLRGTVQLSDELSQKAGRDLVRYTQEQGRVTLPATIGGSAASPQVRIDVGSMAKRAVTNRAREEAQKGLKRGLGGLFGK